MAKKKLSIAEKARRRDVQLERDRNAVQTRLDTEQSRINKELAYFLSNPEEHVCVPIELVERSQALVDRLLLERDQPSKDPWSDEKYPAIVMPDDRLRSVSSNYVDEYVGLPYTLASATHIIVDTWGVDALGLAAPQMGTNTRLLYMKIQGDFVGVKGFVNVADPWIEVMPDSMKVYMDEGCLSIPGLFGKVERHTHIKLHGTQITDTNPPGKEEICYDLRGIDAQLAQHEVDHLYGILFVDRANPYSLHWSYNKE